MRALATCGMFQEQRADQEVDFTRSYMDASSRRRNAADSTWTNFERHGNLTFQGKMAPPVAGAAVELVGIPRHAPLPKYESTHAPLPLHIITSAAVGN